MKEDSTLRAGIQSRANAPGLSLRVRSEQGAVTRHAETSCCVNTSMVPRQDNAIISIPYPLFPCQGAIRVYADFFKYGKDQEEIL